MLTKFNKFFKKRNWKLDYLVVLLLICVSGNSAFDAIDRQILVLVLVCGLFGVLFIRKREIQMPLRASIILLIFCVIFAFQYIAFDFFPHITIAGFFTRFFVAYFAVRLVKEFPNFYIKVMFHISILSLCFYVPDQICNMIGIDFRSNFLPLRELLGVDTRFNIGLYNFQSGESFHRNAAFFWEPGAFAVYLSLAILFLGLQKGSYVTREYGKILGVFIVSLLTTFSTTGYVLLPLCLLLHTDLSITARKGPRLLLVMAVMILLAVWFFRVDFVGNKLIDQYDEAISSRNNQPNNRIGTLLYQLDYIRVHPFIGWGPHSKTRYMPDGGEDITSSGSGLGDFACKFGLFGLATFIICLWKGVFELTKHNRAKTFLFVLFVLIMLNGEDMLNLPLFISLMFLSMRPSVAGHNMIYATCRGGNYIPLRKSAVRTGMS